MKRVIIYFLWTFLCLHTTVSFSQAASADDIDAILADINSIVVEPGEDISESELEDDIDSMVTLEIEPEESISREEPTTSLDSAPVVYAMNTPVVYSSWELIHRMPMLQGFAWTGSIASFVTPAMYIGTPLQTNMNTVGYDTTMGPTNYSECVRSETDMSFGPDGEIYQDTVEDELRDIAKFCAVEYLGSYFEWKDYTTREEILMMIFTLFEEDDIGLPGYFDDNRFVSDGREVDVPYANIDGSSWYASYVTRAYEYVMVEDEETWKIARKATDTDIRTMLENYSLGEDVGTEYGSYRITIDDGIKIEKYNILNSAPETDESAETISTTDDTISSEDILRELFGE